MRTILLWNDDWGIVGPPRPLGIPGWEIVHDRRMAPLADAIAFHIPTLDEAAMPHGRHPGQRFVAWSMESVVNYPCLDDPAYMARFDLSMTYRRSSDIWVPYIPRPEILLVPPGTKSEAAPAVYIASNPRNRSGRDDYVAELMRHLPVDSYGTQLRNRTLEGDDGRRTKLLTIARYRFTLAFENSIAPDYVTEKFFDALIAGSVPVVLGAPNVRDFAPSAHSYIDKADFDGPAALAAYLRGLAADETAYAEYLAWKRSGLSPEFGAMLSAGRPDPWTRLARLLIAT
ncbi:MAG: glycosyltransferase family 10 [Betaproteobacteria bacterium]